MKSGTFRVRIHSFEQTRRKKNRTELLGLSSRASLALVDHKNLRVAKLASLMRDAREDEVCVVQNHVLAFLWARETTR